MSRIPKWKLDKAKVKVVFRLQFHATHIPQPGWDKLFVSFIPADTGKATAKTNKANVRNGNCKWSDPIYETTRFLQDTRTKNYDEKLYKLVVAMGTSRSSLLGEVNINLADFADASKPSSVSLPLDGCEFGTVLHVTVQLLTSKTGFREFEQQREIREKGFHLISNQDNESAGKIRAVDQTDKVNTRVRFKPGSTKLPSLEEVGRLKEDYEDSAAGVDGSSCTSEGIYADKNDISSAHEVDSIKSTTSGEVSGFPSGQSPQPEKGEQCDHRLLAQGSNDWAHGWSSDYSIDNDLATAYEENSKLRGCLEVAESSILELKMEVSSLQSLADELGTETQRLTHEFATELASGEILANKVSTLKFECSKFKGDFEEFKRAKGRMHYTDGRMNISSSDAFSTILENNEGNRKEHGRDPSSLTSCGQVRPMMRKSDVSGDNTSAENQDYLVLECQKKWVQGLMLMEDKVKEIQNKADIRYHENDHAYLLSDFETLECYIQNLRQCFVPCSRNVDPIEGIHIKEIETTNRQQFQPLVPVQGHEGDSNNVMKEKVCDLLTKLEESKIEQESLTKKMNQMECYYEALIHDLEESHRQTLTELENIRTEHSSCLYTISAFQSQTEKIHQDMNEQFLKFAEDRQGLETLNKELEKRAVASETALKRVRWNYSIAVGRLQKDLELLSIQVLSMHETNESLARQAFADASQLYSYEYPRQHSEVPDSCQYRDDSRAPFQQVLYKPSALEIQL